MVLNVNVFSQNMQGKLGHTAEGIAKARRFQHLDDDGLADSAKSKIWGATREQTSWASHKFPPPHFRACGHLGPENSR
jgi:hypothetical protein